MLLDTSAWIELLEATKNAVHVKEALLKENCYTSIVTIAEIVNWAEKERKDYGKIIENIGKASTIMGLDEQISVLAGRLNFERKKANRKWGMIDSFILASATIYGLKILTKDNDFSDVAEAVVL